jgi:hypothetical protein
LEALARYLHECGHWLIIEWVPKEDSQVQKLLANRQDIFTNYHMEGFESSFEYYFNIREKSTITDSPRVIYLMESK